jgi:hypothetical protein
VSACYLQVLDVIDGLFVSIFDGINARCKKELEAVNSQYPFEPLKVRDPFCCDCFWPIWRLHTGIHTQVKVKVFSFDSCLRSFQQIACESHISHQKCAACFRMDPVSSQNELE